MVINSIDSKIYFADSKIYFAALTILRNIILDEAYDLLTSHGCVLNFKDIISRLDFGYADKSSFHLLEREIGIIRQGNKRTIDYCIKVNKKLTLKVNKTIMTYGFTTEMTLEINKRNLHKCIVNIYYCP